MKYLLFFLIFSHSSFGQTYGGLKVQLFKNETNDLNDNYQLDSTEVRIVNKRYSVDTTITFTSANNFKCLLRSGKYKLICSTNREKDIVVEGVLISGDKITFIDLLIEPEADLNFFQKRKRKKKRYANLK